MEEKDAIGVLPEPCNFLFMRFSLLPLYVRQTQNGTKYFATSLFDSELAVTLVDSGIIARILFDEFEPKESEEGLSVLARRG